MERLLPTLKPDELRNLEKSIKQEGCRDPLVIGVINGERILVDGHNRHRICKNHGISFATIDMAFEDLVDARVWMRRNAVSKRNLNDAQVIDLESANKDDLAEKGREKMSAGGKGLSIVDKPSAPKHNTQREVAKRAGVSTGKVAMAEVVKKKAPEVWQKALDGELTVGAAYKVVRERKKRDEQALRKYERDTKTAEAVNDIETKRKTELSSVCDIRCCSCADLFASGVAPDVVITDPPYPAEFLDTFTELAKACADAGVKTVAVMSGQAHLPEVFKRLCEHLTYRWTMAYLTPGGQAAQVFPRKVNAFCKPVIDFGVGDWIGDVVKSDTNDNDKTRHYWGQSESGMSGLVERLSNPGDLICDPFVGGGTTAVVSLGLGRRFVGCDIDQEMVNRAVSRVEASHA
jgi:site-specific DNA-methyltransferase (adenine-specific)